MEGYNGHDRPLDSLVRGTFPTSRKRARSRQAYDPRPNLRGAAPGGKVATPPTIRRDPGQLADLTGWIWAGALYVAIASASSPWVAARGWLGDPM